MNSTLIINATNLGKYLDGIGVYALNLLRELAQLGSDTNFIIYINRSSIEHISKIDFPSHCTIRVISGALSPDHGFRGHLLRLLYSNYLGLKHWGSVIFVASQLEAILFRRNQIITIHDIIPLLFGKLHKRQYLYFKYVLKFVLWRAFWVITPSRHTKELLVERYGIGESKISVIHNGVRNISLSKNQQHVEPDGEARFILFSGRMVPMKNLAGLLRAFSFIKDKVPHKIVVTGHCRTAELVKAMTELIDQNAIERDRVEFRGHVSTEELEGLMRNASVLAFPSFYEGFGLPPLEGMAHGCPVLVSNVSSLPEVCADAAHYVDPNDTQSIAEGLHRLLTDHTLRKSLVEKGLSRAKRFQWRESALKHLHLFDEASLAYRSVLSLNALEWRLAAAMQAHPVLALLLSSVLRHHHVR